MKWRLVHLDGDNGRSEQIEWKENEAETFWKERRRKFVHMI